jgi:hypothetical protein
MIGKKLAQYPLSITLSADLYAKLGSDQQNVANRLDMEDRLAWSPCIFQNRADAIFFSGLAGPLILAAPAAAVVIVVGQNTPYYLAASAILVPAIFWVAIKGRDLNLRRAELVSQVQGHYSFAPVVTVEPVITFVKNDLKKLPHSAKNIVSEILAVTFRDRRLLAR